MKLIIFVVLTTLIFNVIINSSEGKYEEVMYHDHNHEYGCCGKIHTSSQKVKKKSVAGWKWKYQKWKFDQMDKKRKKKYKKIKSCSTCRGLIKITHEEDHKGLDYDYY